MRDLDAFFLHIK